MALRGKGMLIVFNEVKPRHERDFNEWYNREHIDERVNLPGFHRARRYVAVKASPKYLATYECDTVEDLATPGYLALLADQTPWTKAVMARFTHFKRMTRARAARPRAWRGRRAHHGALRAHPAMRRQLHRLAARRPCRRAIARPGMVGAAVVENDLETANAPVRPEQHGPSQGRAGRMGGAAGRRRSRRDRRARPVRCSRPRR